MHSSLDKHPDRYTRAQYPMGREVLEGREGGSGHLSAHTLGDLDLAASPRPLSSLAPKLVASVSNGGGRPWAFSLRD